MFLLDSLDNIEKTSIYLSRPSGEPLACLDEYIDESSARMKRGLNQQQELSFTINRQDNSWYEYIQEGMYLYVETIGLFRMQQPSVEYDGVKEIKTVSALSVDNELEDKVLNIEINMGTKTSQEYLVQYDDVDANEEIVNPYTNVPYDWIVLYNTFPEQLTAHLADYDSGKYGGTPSTDINVTDADLINELLGIFNLVPRLKNSFTKTIDTDTGSTDYTLVEYVQISTDDETGATTKITLFDTYRARLVYLISFYTRNRNKLSLIPMVLDKMGGSWSVGDIYGLSDGDYSLANSKYQFEIDGSIYSFLVSDLAQVSNCMITFDILTRKVNIIPVEQIGENTGITISYDNLLNNLNISADEENLTTRITVTGADDLSIEQVNFGLDYIDDISYKMNAIDENGNRIYVTDELAEKYLAYTENRETLRDEFIECSKSYSNYEKKINELKYRVPLDDLKTDWGTFTLAELSASLTTYKNLLASLVSLYREDYYPDGINSDDSVNETYMKTTPYWYDYDAYKGIITEIECAIATFPYYNDHDKWSSYNKQIYENAIKAWETEWTLYGTIELQAKIEAYKQNMDLLAESSVIRTAVDADTIKTWSQLTSSEKTQFGNSESNYQYDIYMGYYNNMVSATTYLATLQAEIDAYILAQQTAQTRRTEIVSEVTLENNFTADELKVIYLMFRDSDCSNENILVTSLDSVEKKLETMRELLEYGQEQLSIMSRPQLSFSISSDNLLALKEFKEYWTEFKVGNYIMVQYRDDTFMKLRMIGYEYNPCMPSSKDFTITFSNYVRSKIGVSDLENLLGSSSGGSGGRGSSGGSGGSGSGYGESDDIDVTISNTMLSKLLNSETFGTRVKDVILNTIDVNSITAKYANFNGLASGTTTIDGKCITTGYIIDIYYNGTSGDIDNTTGSVINLETGKFNLAGRIKWDSSALTIGKTVVGSTSYRNIYVTDSALSFRYGTTALCDITTSGMTLKNSNGTQIASFGSNITIGYESYNNIYITSSAMNLRYGSTTLLNLTTSGMTLKNSNGNDVASFSHYSIVMGDSTTKATIGDSNISFRKDNVDVGKVGYGYYTNDNNLLGVTLWINRATSTKKPAYAGIVADASDGKNYFKLIYLQDNASISGYTSGALNAGCDLDMNYNNIKDVDKLYFGTEYFDNLNGGGIYCSSNLYAVGYVQAGGNIACSGVAFIGNVNYGSFTLHVNGASYFNGAITVNGKISGYGSLDISGNIDVGGYIDAYVKNQNGQSKVPVGSSDDIDKYCNTIQTNSSGMKVYGSFGSDTGTQTNKSFAASSSDRRLKRNIKDTSVYALDIIKQIKHKEFDWIDSGRHIDVGYIAQEMEEISDDLVMKPESEDEYYGIDTFYLQGVMTKAMQEQQVIIESLQKEIEILKRKVG